VSSESTEGRTGPLRNGNPRGDPSLAPRCGAKNRAGCPCRAPAMKNGRCRMHGGKSTGPRTAEGLARLRAARTTHGYYTAESKAARRRVAALIAEARALLAAQREAAVVAKTRALVVLQRAGAHPVEPIAPRYLRGAGAGAPAGRKARAGGKSLC